MIEPTAVDVSAPKSVGQTLHDGQGSKLSIRASLAKRQPKTFAIHKPKGGTAARGATQVHASVDGALAALEEMVKAAEALGWQRSKRIGARPDAFDLSHLPAPAKKVAKRK